MICLNSNRYFNIFPRENVKRENYKDKETNK